MLIGLFAASRRHRVEAGLAECALPVIDAEQRTMRLPRVFKTPPAFEPSKRQREEGFKPRLLVQNQPPGRSQQPANLSERSPYIARRMKHIRGDHNVE